MLERAAGRARTAGFAGVTVACEPTGHRWRVLDQLANERGTPLVCVQWCVCSRCWSGEPARARITPATEPTTRTRC